MIQHVRLSFFYRLVSKQVRRWIYKLIRCPGKSCFIVQKQRLEPCFELNKTFFFAYNCCLTSLQWILGGCGVVTLEHFCLQGHEGHGKFKNRRFRYFDNPYSKRRLNISMKNLIQIWKNFSDRKSDSRVMAKYVKTGSCYVISLISSRFV